MDILIKPKKNRYIIYAIIIAIFSTVGMNISLMNTNADKLLKKFEYSSTSVSYTHLTLPTIA